MMLEFVTSISDCTVEPPPFGWSLGGPPPVSSTEAAIDIVLAIAHVPRYLTGTPRVIASLIALLNAALSSPVPLQAAPRSLTHIERLSSVASFVVTAPTPGGV